MFTRTPAFDRQIRRIDRSAQVRISQAIAKVESGLGDVKAVGGGLFEIRVDFGPGYRVYFANGRLLGVGDKKSQARDIAAARAEI